MSSYPGRAPSLSFPTVLRSFGQDGALLSQCLSDSKCRTAAVARVLTLRVSLGLPPCSEATAAYSKARAKLPVPLLRRLATRLGGELERQAPPG